MSDSFSVAVAILCFSILMWIGWLAKEAENKYVQKIDALGRQMIQLETDYHNMFKAFQLFREEFKDVKEYICKSTSEKRCNKNDDMSQRGFHVVDRHLFKHSPNINTGANLDYLRRRSSMQRNLLEGQLQGGLSV